MFVYNHIDTLYIYKIQQTKECSSLFGICLVCAMVPNLGVGTLLTGHKISIKGRMINCIERICNMVLRHTFINFLKTFL